MELISWNVNGLRAVAGKGFLSWFRKAAPDVLLLQETKARREDLSEEVLEIPGYRCRFAAAERRGYSGTGIYCREEPDEWIEGIRSPDYDCEGRVVGARFGDLVVLSAYFPNSQAAGARLDYRLGFGRAMRRFLTGRRKLGQHVVLAGDFNVAHQPIDLARPKQNEANPGYLPEERDWFSRFLAAGYVDTWRRQHPDRVGYSWWSFRSNARAKGIGWRLDYFVVNEELWPRVRGAGILDSVTGSDHCPISLELDP